MQIVVMKQTNYSIHGAGYIEIDDWAMHNDVYNQCISKR